MPSSRPCAAFEPISPDFDLQALVESTPNFEYVVRIDCSMIDHQGIENFEKLVLIHVILGGKPLVVQGYETRLDRWTFALQWLRDNCGSKVENARDLTKKRDVPLSINHYLNHMALLTNQWTDSNYKDPERQRMYLKDIDCPQLWHDKLQTVIPGALFYLNETIGDVGGFGCTDEPEPNGLGTRRGKGIAKAGDLMSSLPKEMRAENLMCYIGHEGTYTPAHREMCASLGQNLMVEASTGLPEDHKPTKPGSSIWFMTERKEREVVSEYWLSKLGHDIEVENHFAQINAWKNAPFKTYVVEQRPGDFILIPPLAPHQVWNRGTRTMKVAWNRTTVETLELALQEALPRARMVCRDEQYKNKAIIFYTLQKYSKLLRNADKAIRKDSGSKRKSSKDAKVRQLEKDFRRLHNLYTKILLSECFSDQTDQKAELVPFDSNITCSYCRCNIFNRFLTCPSCVEDLDDGEKDTYDICMDCYAMGRSCACISKLKWVEQFPWAELVKKHEQWRQQILTSEVSNRDNLPMSLKIELQRFGRKRTLAQVCQLELAKRPWRDITKPPPAIDGVVREQEIEVDANGKVKKKKKVRRSEKFTREHGRCHVDCHWEPKWKQAQCSTCDKNFCYGILFRAYDMMPQDVMADPTWECPSCQNICGCRHCRPKSGYKPYTPSGTLLGHNTKAVADPRSVESLVDFSYSNIAWIQKAGDDKGGDTKRLEKRRKDAEAAKAQDPDLGEDYVGSEQNGHDEIENRLLYLAQHENIPIDPALTAMDVPDPSDTAEDEDEYDENPEGPRQKVILSNNVSMAPHCVVPEGGIIRDTVHAYDQTEAITYDYPDPDAGRNSVVVHDEDSAVIGDGPAITDNPGKIEMVDRKRKRAKFDEGDKPYNFKQSVIKKQKKRQSLVVRLSVNKDKLSEIKKVKIMAQKALDSAPEVPAPVVNSDLQALNTHHSTMDGQPLPKKMRLDSVLPDRDDEFTPSRYRDRRKGVAEGEAPAPRYGDITRRQTRMQNVSYENLSDEVHSEIENVQPYARPRQELVTMEQAGVDEDASSATPGTPVSGSESPGPAATTAVDSYASNLPQAQAASRQASVQTPMVAAVSATKSPQTKSHAQKPANATRTAVVNTKPSEAAPSPQTKSRTTSVYQARPVSAQRPSTSSSTASNNDASKSLAAAQENRRAKMAAVEWAGKNMDSLEGAWSEDESMSTKQAEPNPLLSPAPKLVPARQDLPNPSKKSPTITLPTANAPIKAIAVPKLKMSVNDWASDSDDDDPPYKTSSAAGTSARAPTNGHGAFAARIGRPPATGFKPTTEKKRGRPSLRGK